MTEEPVEVIQADRQAAADFMAECAPYLSDCGMKASVELALRQAFRRHRLSHSAEKQTLIEALEKIARGRERRHADGTTELVDDPDIDPMEIARSTLLSMRNNGNG